MITVSGSASRRHGTLSPVAVSTLPVTATTTGMAPITMSASGAPAALIPITSSR